MRRLPFNLKFKFTLLIFIVSIHCPVHAQLTPLTNFGANPGELAASYYLPDRKASNLVVLLHGCVQNGETLAEQSGFLSLAKANNFALLMPQQNTDNNIKDCFNWFSPQDIEKDQGEILSIKNMILAVKKKTKSNKVFIAGLSAGGAMTHVMLVHYPELFESAAIIAGIPFPCADNLIKAISCMRNGPSQTSNDLIQLVNSVNDSTAKWPNLTIWTGTADNVVNPRNSTILAQQWAGLKDINTDPIVTQYPSYQTKHWKNGVSKNAVELVMIDGLDHGISVNSTIKNGGESGPFLLESPISAAVNIVKFWHLGH